MKKILISIFTLALISTSAFAVIPKGCQSNLDDVINNQIEFNKKAPELIASGELTN